MGVVEEDDTVLLSSYACSSSTSPKPCNDSYALPPKQVPVHLPFVNPTLFKGRKRSIRLVIDHGFWFGYYTLECQAETVCPDFHDLLTFKYLCILKVVLFFVTDDHDDDDKDFVFFWGLRNPIGGFLKFGEGIKLPHDLTSVGLGFYDLFVNLSDYDLQCIEQ
ncbi:hypothetical protein VNO77_11056 [Canavalia gladiata]|uniref:Uncharacterized protein n=1 Tax=Canavalia gladiata TaxID=3824 RepID=A0AAN9R2G3_CANGL